MQITETMDLHQLTDRVPEQFNLQQTSLLRVLLNGTRYKTLADIPEGVWLNMLERVKIQSMMA